MPGNPVIHIFDLFIKLNKITNQLQTEQIKDNLKL